MGPSPTLGTQINKKSMDIKETKQQNNTAFIEVLVPTQRVDEIKEEVVTEMIKNVTVKGFRQGKAPKNIAEKNLEPEKLSNHIFSHVLNSAIREALKGDKYQLLGRPVLDKFEPQKDGSWKIDFKIPLMPQFKLGDYKKAVQKIKVENKQEKKVEDIYEALLKSIKIDVSEVLVEQEANYSLERLENHAKSLNLTLDKYFEALKKTKEEVLKEYSEKAEESIKLDLILLEIAKVENIDTSDKEIEELSKISAVPADQKEQLKSILTRRKTIDFLLKV